MALALGVPRLLVSRLLSALAVVMSHDHTGPTYKATYS